MTDWRSMTKDEYDAAFDKWSRRIRDEMRLTKEELAELHARSRRLHPSGYLPEGLDLDAIEHDRGDDYQ